MIFYQIYDIVTYTWFHDSKFYGWLWGDRKEATFWAAPPKCMVDTILASNASGNGIHIRRPVIKPYDIWEARQVLLDLNATWNLMAISNHIRDNQCDGRYSDPKVNAWEDACERARKVMQ